MSYVSEAVIRKFEENTKTCLEIIKQSGISYLAVGIFGSYARKEYKATSDIDFCIIVNETQPRHIKGGLREDLEEHNADVCFVTENYFKNNTSAFAQNLRRDFIQLL